MKKTKLAVAFGLVSVVALTGSAPLHAACGLITQSVAQSLGTFFSNCPDAHPVSFDAFLIASPGTVNSAGQDGACEAATGTNGLGQQCTPESGVAGDGNIQALYDWGSWNGGSVGCPSPLGDTEGGSPIAVQMLANDGEGVIATLGYDIGYGGYDVDLVFPFDGSSFGNLSCSRSNAPIITGSSSGPAPDVTQVCLHLNPTSVYTDCDPASGGAVVGSCPTGLAPAVDRGRLYVRGGACGQPPDPHVSTGWTLLANQPDANGNACNSITTGSDQCTYIGATGSIGGFETPAIAGTLSACTGTGCLAVIDVVFIDQVKLSQGKIVVTFETVNEATIVGFNVYAAPGNKLNTGGLIPAKGAGSNLYTFEVSRGAIHAYRVLTVEAVKNDGSSVFSGPVRLTVK